MLVDSKGVLCMISALSQCDVRCCPVRTAPCCNNSLLRDITPRQHHCHREHSTAHIPTFSFLTPVALPNDEVVVGVTCEQSTLALRTSERQVCMPEAKWLRCYRSPPRSRRAPSWCRSISSTSPRTSAPTSRGPLRGLALCARSGRL